MKTLLTIKEAAQLLKINPFHLYRLTREKRIPFSKIPGVGIRFDLDSLEKWIQEAKTEPIDWQEKAKEFTR